MQQEHRIPSNRMPQAARNGGVVGGVILSALLAVLIAAAVWVLVGTRGLFGIVALLVVLALWLRDRRWKSMAAQRASESICTFARSFDCREIDTWIIRAVYEEVSDNVPFPPRRDDRLEDDLGIDPEDIDDIAEVVAFGTGRPLDGCERNPWSGRVKTVGDMVSFFAQQAKRTPAAA